MPETRDAQAGARASEPFAIEGAPGESVPDSLAALIILVLTYVGVAAGRIPGLRLDRAGIAFLGGAAMIAVGPLSRRRKPFARSISTPSLFCLA